MKNIRLAVVTLCVLTVAGVTAGCGSTNLGAGSPSAPSPLVASPTPMSAKDALLASTKVLDETTFEFQVKQPEMSWQGQMDAPNKAALINITTKASGQTIAMGFTLIGSDVWMKFDFGATLNSQFGLNKNKWMLIDQTKVDDKSSLPLSAGDDLTSTGDDLLAGLVEVQRVDDAHFTGTMDVTNADDMLAPDKEVLTKVGDKAKAVPFTATLDAEGRLVEVKTDGTGIDKDLSTVVTFTKFGAAQPITKPAGAIPAPAKVYEILNG